MLHLPPNLALLAKLADKNATRFATSALLIQEIDGGCYQILVTDNKRLTVVTGPGQEDSPEDTHGIAQALVPAKDFQEAIAKLTKRRSPDHPCVILGETATRFSSGRSQIEVANTEGRFPDTNSVIKNLYSVFRVKVDARLLAELLLVAAAFAPDHSPGAVIMHFGRTNHPFVITTDNGKGQRFQACCMPLS